MSGQDRPYRFLLAGLAASSPQLKVSFTPTGDGTCHIAVAWATWTGGAWPLAAAMEGNAREPPYL